MIKVYHCYDNDIDTQFYVSIKPDETNQLLKFVLQTWMTCNFLGKTEVIVFGPKKIP